MSRHAASSRPTRLSRQASRRPGAARLAALAVLTASGALAMAQPGSNTGTGDAAETRVTIATSVAAETRLSAEQAKELRQETFELGRGHLAIGGYDPVAYFPEGGSKPAKGKRNIAHEHNGVLYRFATEDNRDRFKKNPERYEPAFGGWCAYAMSHEGYTEPNPKRFLIQNDRLMLFYDGLFGDTFDAWQDEGPAKLEPLADTFWKTELTEKANEIAR